jgi:hypothetical protein
VFSWHPGRLAERASQVQVTLAAADGQTLVTLEHAGWEAFDDPAAARAEYDQGFLNRMREAGYWPPRPGWPPRTTPAWRAGCWPSPSAGGSRWS